MQNRAMRVVLRCERYTKITYNKEQYLEYQTVLQGLPINMVTTLEAKTKSLPSKQGQLQKHGLHCCGIG